MALAAHDYLKGTMLSLEYFIDDRKALEKVMKSMST